MRKILEIKFGSHLYGTDTPNSDLDLKAIYLPTAKEICLGNYKKTITTCRPKQTHERNTKEDIDLEVFSLDRYLDLLTQGQTVALDMLFAPASSYTFGNDYLLWIFEEISQWRFQLLNRNVNAFVGYAKQQAAKYGQKGFRVHALRETLAWLKPMAGFQSLLDIGDETIKEFIANTGNEHIKIVEIKGPNGLLSPHLDICDKKYPLHASVKYVETQVQRRFDEYGARALAAERNEGVDWKALSHAVRVNSEAKQLLETGVITFPCPNRELLLAIKQGKMPYVEVAALIEQGLEELKVSQAKSCLNPEPNLAWVQNFIYDIYSSIVKGDL